MLTQPRKIIPEENRNEVADIQEQSEEDTVDQLDQTEQHDETP